MLDKETKQKIVNKLDTWAHSELGDTFTVKDDGGDLTLLKKLDDGSDDFVYIAWFQDFNSCKPDYASYKPHLCVEIIERDIIRSFYLKAVAYIRKYSPRYTIQIFNSTQGFLMKQDGSLLNLTTTRLYDREDYRSYAAYFTEEEIEWLKKQKDISINWGTAIIKEVK